MYRIVRAITEVEEKRRLLQEISHAQKVVITYKLNKDEERTLVITDVDIGFINARVIIGIQIIGFDEDGDEVAFNHTMSGMSQTQYAPGHSASFEDFFSRIDFIL
jgi:hypothetical protein